MAKCIDLTGQKFGRLLVVERGTNNNEGKAMWYCKCDCGNPAKILVRGKDLRSGNTQSCGCYARELTSQRSTKHGLSHTKLHNIWTAMKERCYNPNAIQFKDWGGRGITVCDEWLGEHGSENFIAWAYANGFKQELTLDRINVDGNYEPSNCRWVTMKEQSRNKRNNIEITYCNKTQTLADWAIELNINYRTLYARYRSGWSVERMLTTPVTKHE